MQGWRVSKYDPSRRDAVGRYVHEEWTSVYDIGKSIAGQVLTVEEYLRVENAYIETAMVFHADAGAPFLLARDVEIAGSNPNIPGDVVSVPPAEGQPIGRADLVAVIRSCLREIFWCRLEAEEKLCMIHFGYDYYMYLTGMSLTAHTFDVARAGGLFLEPFQSPYSLPCEAK